MTIEELIEKYKKLLSDVPQKMDEMDAWIATCYDIRRPKITPRTYRGERGRDKKRNGKIKINIR